MPTTDICHHHLSETDSTNSQLMAAMLASFGQVDANNQTLPNSAMNWQPQPHYTRAYRLTADHQRAGRGQHGRVWQSPLGNLYYSLYIPSEKYADDAVRKTGWALARPLDGRLSLCVGYQLAQLLAGKGIDTTRHHPAASSLGVKWVNDIGWYIGADFCKLAGILLEPVTAHGNMLGVVMGVGINVAHAPDLPPQVAVDYRAVALADVLAAAQLPPLADLAQAVDGALMQAVAQFNGLYDAQTVPIFCQQFATVDLLLGKRVQVLPTQGDTPPIVGVGQGIDAAGCLQVRLSDCAHHATVTRIWNGRVRVLDAETLTI